MDLIRKNIFVLVFSAILIAGLAFASADVIPGSSFSSSSSNPPGITAGQALPSTSFSGISSSSDFVNPAVYQAPFQTYYSSNQLSTYWPVLNSNNSCEARQDFILQVAPGGCQPMVVTSDLLAQQNVPVFCQIDALQLNPLINVKEIQSMTFAGNYPRSVVATGFHPARAALQTRDQLLGSPIISNIGYAVVVLRQNANESSLPNFVTANLTATLLYNPQNVLGIGQAEFVLSPQSDDQWANARARQSFWNGRYSIKLERADPTSADISIYEGISKVTTTRVALGSTSTPIYLPGFFCQASLQVQFEGFVAAETSAKLEISNNNGGTQVIDVYKGSKILNNQCTVDRIDLDLRDNQTGNVSISCGYSQSVKLQLKNLTIQNIVNNSNQVFKAGDHVVYKGWSATVTSALPDGNYAISIYGVAPLSVINNLINGINKVSNSLGIGYTAPSVPHEVSASDLTAAVNVGPKDRMMNSETDIAFNDAISSYEKIADAYPTEKSNSLSVTETYGEQALDAAILLSEQYSKSATEARLISKFLTIYPNSLNSEGYRIRLQQLYTFDSSLAGQVVYANNQYSTIRLDSFSQPAKLASAQFIVGNNNNPVVVAKSQTVNLLFNSLPGNSPANSSGQQSLGTITLNSISTTQASITAACKTNGISGQQTLISNSNYVLNVNDQGKYICGQLVRLDKTDLEQVAKVQLIPTAERVQSIANLTVNIGIEKRAIQLSPQKTQDMISSLNSSINKWQSISNSLSKVVTGLKGACFATSAVLITKNFLTGLSGAGAARQMVMRGGNGWDVKCKQMVAQGQYSTLDQCYLKNADQINQDVSAVSSAISGINSRVKVTEVQQPSSGVFSSLGLESSADRSASANAYAKDLLNRHGNSLVPNATGSMVPLSSVISSDGYSKGEYTFDQLKQYDMYLSLSGGSNTLQDNEKATTIQASKQIADNRNLLAQIDSANNLAKKGFAAPASILAANQKQVYAPVVPISNIPSNIIQAFNDPSIQYSATIPVNGLAVGKASQSSSSGSSSQIFQSGVYVAGLAPSGSPNTYIIRKIALINSDGSLNKVLSDSEEAQFSTSYSIGTVVAQNSLQYNNPYKNPQIQYYETGPYKGMPAVVPFDLLKGWYVATKSDLPVFGGTGAFESSGRVSSFWLCNVGLNGLEQFQEGYGDDICQLINLNSGQPLNKFPGLDDQSAQKLITQATQALTDAANQYGSKIVKINGQNLVVGQPAINSPATQCQDFMDPKDCYLMFNVCDPVICPSSRCNFGGAYPVSDVIQTGIIGSTLLCLPNVKEGIAIPVCLTGIEAGIDSYVSILKNHRDCLQASLTTGQSVGICDEIYSIYACEFFWSQIAPVANALLPKIVAAAYGQGTRGGGEYLTVTSAWQNTQNSINYFTNIYAVNSLKAFQIRSVDEVGTPFCKAFVSAKGPSSINSLIQPDSPPQFNAWFSTTPFSDATVPATTQYKVFYHIFAGNDAGISFRVYLKNPPQSSYYYSTPTLIVDSGFVATGQYASQTRDFTGPAGYKQLCVDINGNEQCGFNQVSTSFATNIISDAYSSSQIQNSGIMSQSGCISGQASLGGLLTNANPQAALQTAVSPQNYNNGIVRICASQNPGSSTSPTRFVDVGYCDDQKIRCWLDKNSVQNAISTNDIYIQNQTLSSIQSIQMRALEVNGSIMSVDRANQNIGVFESNLAGTLSFVAAQTDPAIAKSVVSGNISDIYNAFGSNLDQLFFNYHKSEVLLIVGKLKGALSMFYLKASPAVQIGSTNDTVPLISHSNFVGSSPMNIPQPGSQNKQTIAISRGNVDVFPVGFSDSSLYPKSLNYNLYYNPVDFSLYFVSNAYDVKTAVGIGSISQDSNGNFIIQTDKNAIAQLQIPSPDSDSVKLELNSLNGKIIGSSQNNYIVQASSTASSFGSSVNGNSISSYSLKSASNCPGGIKSNSREINYKNNYISLFISSNNDLYYQSVLQQVFCSGTKIGTIESGNVLSIVQADYKTAAGTSYNSSYYNDLNDAKVSGGFLVLNSA